MTTVRHKCSKYSGWSRILNQVEGLIPDVKFIATFTQHQTNFWLAEKFDRSLYLHRTVRNFISVHTGLATSQGWISIFFQWFYHLFKWSATLENQTSILHLSYHPSMEPRFCRMKIQMVMVFTACTLQCVVPENIQTSTTEGIGNSRGVGGSEAQEIPEGRGVGQ